MTRKIEELSGAIFDVSLLMSIDYRLRDNDVWLCKAFEAIQTGKINKGRKNWKRKLIKFVDRLSKQKPTTPPETISRARRIIQYNHGLLLGDRAKARKQAAEEIKNAINKI